MGFFNNFPYTNFHELNLDWILAKIKELSKRVEDVPTEGGLNEVREEVVETEQRLNSRIDNLNAADVGAIPSSVTKLPNPQALTFTGAVAGTYDGSSPVTVHIPQGGGAGSVEPLTFSGAVSATYDGSAPVSVNIPEKSATPSVLTFTGGATGTFDGSAPLSINIPTGGGGSGEANQPLVFSGAVSASYDGSTQVNVEIPQPPTVPTALPNPQALTFSGAITGTYDGSAPLNVIIPGSSASNFYTFADSVRVATPANQGEGTVTFNTEAVLSNGDILLVTYLPYNQDGSYPLYCPYSAVIPVGLLAKTGDYALTAIDLNSESCKALSRKVHIAKVDSGFSVTYGPGYQASLGSNSAVVNNNVIGIRDVTIIKKLS